MLTSFKKFRQLNESIIGGTFALGLANPTAIGLEEGKKKAKKMLGDELERDEDDLEAAEDDEVDAEDDADADMDDADDDDADAEANDEVADDDAEDVAVDKAKIAKDMASVPMMKKCGCGKCKKCSKMKKKMTKEEVQFLDTIKKTYGSSFFNINDDGSFKEDAIIPPTDPNAGLTTEQPNQPGPGEVGFAPQQRLGESYRRHSWFS